MLQTPGSTWSQWRKFPFIARAEVGEPPVDKGKGKEREDAAPALVGLAPLPASNLDWLTSDDAAEITCVAPGRRFAYLGDVLGRVHVVDSKLELVDSFEAHEPPIPAPPPPIPGNPASNAQKRETARRGPVLSFRLAAARAGIRLVGVTHLAWNADRNVLVTAGEDKNGLPVVRLWNLDKMDRTTGRPQMLREVSASLDQRPIPITSIALLPALTHLAIGLENGTVLLVRGDLGRAERTTKSRTVYEGESTITGLMFAEKGSGAELVIVNRDRVMKLGLGSAGDVKSSKVEQPDVLDAGLGTDKPDLLLPLPAPLPSSSSAPPDTQFLLARSEAVYQFSTETGRGNAWFISESIQSEGLGPGEKNRLGWYRGYFALVTKYPVLERKDEPPGSPRSSDSEGQGEGFVSLLTLYDLRNKFVSFSGVFTRDGGNEADFAGDAESVAFKKDLLDRAVGIWAIWSQWGFLWVVTEDRRIYRMAERGLAARLELLFKRNMYSLALNLVQSEQQAVLLGLPGADRAAIEMDQPDAIDLHSPYDYNIVTEIHKRYGDWLYGKGDHDAAISEYCLTIPYLESSYVIRRYLDVQKMDQLARYLEVLHDRGAATPDHTTLLLNCYAKARDEAKLDAFLSAKKELQFDVDTAVTVCRTAGYFKQALELAQRYDHHESVMRIMVDDLQSYRDAVDYISARSFPEAAGLMTKHGAMLVDQEPELSTEILIRMCTGWYPVTRSRKSESPVRGTGQETAVGLGISPTTPNARGTSRPSTPLFDERGKTTSSPIGSGLRSGLDRFMNAATSALPIPGSGRARTPAGGSRGTPFSTSPSPIVSSSLPTPSTAMRGVSPVPGAVPAPSRDDRDALFSHREREPGPFVPPNTASLPRANAAEFVQLYAGQSKLPGTSGAKDEATPAVVPTLTAEQLAKRDAAKTRFCVKFLEQVLEKRGKGRVYSASEVERSLTSQGGVQMVGLDEAETGFVLDQDIGRVDKDFVVEEESKVLWNTLLELYLGGTIVGTLIPEKRDGRRSATPSLNPPASEERGERRMSLTVGDGGNQPSTPRSRSPSSVIDGWKPKAMALLRDPAANYDPDHALVLCQSASFFEGVLYLTEKLNLFNDLVRLHMQAKNYPAVVAACLEHGKDYPTLWTEALSYFARHAEDPKAQTELHRLLDEIDKRKLMPLLPVLQILSAPGSTVNIGMVREYILKHVDKQKQQIEEDQKLTREYQEETKRMREEIDDLVNKPILFEATVCSTCNQPLDLPTVHYYCKHAYHERCLPLAAEDADYPECPKCAPNNRMVLEMIRSQEAKAADPEQLRRAMQRNPTGDRWDVVTDFYGRNVFWNSRQERAGLLGGLRK